MVQAARQASAEGGQYTIRRYDPRGDPNLLNWLFITWNTMEEPVRTTPDGSSRWSGDGGVALADETTLSPEARDHCSRTALFDVRSLSARSTRCSAGGRHTAWHLAKLPPDTRLEVIDDLHRPHDLPGA